MPPNQRSGPQPERGLASLNNLEINIPSAAVKTGLRAYASQAVLEGVQPTHYLTAYSDNPNFNKQEQVPTRIQCEVKSDTSTPGRVPTSFKAASKQLDILKNYYKRAGRPGNNTKNLDNQISTPGSSPNGNCNTRNRREDENTPLLNFSEN